MRTTLGIRFRFHRAARRGVTAAGLVAVVLGALLVAASPASAAPVGQPACNYGPYLWHTTSYNECILIGGYSDGDWDVHVGLDLTVPPDYAQQAILNCPANFSAELWGSDSRNNPGFQSGPPPGDDDFLTYLPISPGWPRIGANGLGIEFDKRVNWRVLNEDDGTDEVYVVVTCNDCTTDFNPVRLRTNEIVHNF